MSTEPSPPPAPTVKQVERGITISIEIEHPEVIRGEQYIANLRVGSVQIMTLPSADTIESASVTVPLLTAIAGPIYYTVQLSSGEEIKSPEVNLATSGPAYADTTSVAEPTPDPATD